MRAVHLRRAVAAALLVSLALAGCSPDEEDTSQPSGTSSPTTSASESPSTSQPTVTTPSVAGTPLPPKLPMSTRAVTEFHSPTKNLACHLDEEGGEDAVVGCHVFEHTFADPPSPSDCEGDLMSVVWMDLDDVVTYGMCRGDPFAVPQTVLEYDSASRVGDFACLSERAGVTCWNVATKHGFVVSRDSYRVF